MQSTKNRIILSAHVLTPEVPVKPGMLAYTGPLDTVLPRLTRLGYSGVELISTDPVSIDTVELSRLLEKNSLVPVEVNSGQICAQLGLTFTSTDSGIRGKAYQKLIDCINLAAVWGIPVNIGIIRGTFREGGGEALVKQRALDSLSKLCRYASPLGVRILLETVGPPMMDFINNLDQAHQLIKEVSEQNLGVMYDFFQMDTQETDMFASIREHIGYCYHLHFSDSQRKVPGSGTIDFHKVFSVLKEVGFNGAGSIEIAPAPDQDIATKLAADYLLPLIQDYNSR